jgi:hypothetical protein
MMDAKKAVIELRKLADLIESGEKFEARKAGGEWQEFKLEFINADFETRKWVNKTPIIAPEEGSFVYYPDLAMAKGVGVAYYSEAVYGALAARGVLFDNEEAVIELVEKWTTTQK